MTPYEKAAAILAVLYRLRRNWSLYKPEDILSKCTPAELDFYYNKLCKEEWK